MKYDDIIDLPHYEPKYHKRMNKNQRAAQFAPFSALTGFAEKINEAAKITEKKIELSSDEKEKINFFLIKINKKQIKKAKITYFVSDIKKDSGKYITEIVNIKKIDFTDKSIKLLNNKKIYFNEIIELGEENV